MTEIKDGLVLPLSRLLNDQLTFKGRDITFELVDEQNQVYKASTNLSEEEKKHNRDMEFIYSLSEASGTVVANLVPLQNNDPEFEGLTDSERITKANSLSYQTRQPEPTDTGLRFNPTLDKAVSESSHGKKPQQHEQQQQQQQQHREQQQQKENIRSGDSVKVNKDK